MAPVLAPVVGKEAVASLSGSTLSHVSVLGKVASFDGGKSEAQYAEECGTTEKEEIPYALYRYKDSLTSKPIYDPSRIINNRSIRAQRNVEVLRSVSVTTKTDMIIRITERSNYESDMAQIKHDRANRLRELRKQGFSLSAIKDMLLFVADNPRNNGVVKPKWLRTPWK